MSERYTVMVVDDHPLLRKGMIQLLKLDDRFDVVAEAGDGVEALAQVHASDPDLIVLDLNMKGMSGLDTLTALRQEGVTATVVVLTVSDAKQDVIALVRAGADGYLLKDTEPDEILSELYTAVNGQQVMTERLLPYLQSAVEVDDLQQRLDSLTKREMQILKEISRGLSNKQIAGTLHITEGTVKVRVKNLLKKLDARSRVEMAVRYLENQGHLG